MKLADLMNLELQISSKFSQLQNLCPAFLLLFPAVAGRHYSIVCSQSKQIHTVRTEKLPCSGINKLSADTSPQRFYNMFKSDRSHLNSFHI